MLGVLWALLGTVVGWAEPQPATITVQIQPVIECGRDRDGKLFSRVSAVAIHEGLRYPVDFPTGGVRPASTSSGLLKSSGTLDRGVFRPRTVYPAIPSTVSPPTGRKMLTLFVNFPDRRWDPGSKEAMIEAIGSVPGFIARNSRGQMSVNVSDFREEITIGLTAASHPSWDAIHNEAVTRLAQQYPEVAATAFDHISVVVPRSDFLHFLGIAEWPGSRIVFNGPQPWQVVVHEMGHNLGLHHANAWHSFDPKNPISVPGVLVTYGDPYDVMGDFMQGLDFNVAFKHRLGWIRETEVAQVAESGEYRLHRHDHESASGPLQGLVVGYGPTNRYWLEYRRNAAPSFQVDGVLIRRASAVEWEIHAASGETHLLDMNDRGRTNDFTDSPLTLGDGKVFTDPAQRVEVRVLGYGGEEPNQYVRVQVNSLPPPPPPPSLIITNLANNQVLLLYEPFMVATATPSNADLISRIEFRVDGKLEALGGPDQRVFEWVPSQVGRHMVQLRTIDIYARIADSPRLEIDVTWDPRPIVSGSMGSEVRNLTPGPSGWVALIGGELAFSEDPFDWTSAIRTPVPGVGITDIACSEGIYVAVGWGGIRFSRNGRSWQPGVVEGEVFLNRVARFGHRWFAAGKWGTLLRSEEDGDRWSRVPLETTDHFFGLAASPNELVALGQMGARVRLDQNGTLTEGRLPISSSSGVGDLTFGGDRFLAWIETAGLLASRNGVAWISTFPAGYERTFFGYSGTSYAVGPTNVWVQGSQGGAWTKLLGSGVTVRYPNSEMVGWGNRLLVTSPRDGATSFMHFAIPPDPYRHWSTQEFGDADRPEAMPESDPDHDGRLNLLEYAVGSDPQVPESRGDLSLALHRPGWIDFTVNVSRRRPDVRYMVESSSDLRTWSYEFELPIQEAELNDTARFYRLRVEKIPH